MICSETDFKLSSQEFNKTRKKIIEAICLNSVLADTNYTIKFYEKLCDLVKKHRKILPPAFIMTNEEISKSVNIPILMKYWFYMNKWKAQIRDEEAVSSCKTFVLIPQAEIKAVFVKFTKKNFKFLVMNSPRIPAHVKLDFQRCFYWPRESKLKLLDSIATDGLQIKFTHVKTRIITVQQHEEKEEENDESSGNEDSYEDEDSSPEPPRKGKSLSLIIYSALFCFHGLF